MDCEQFMQCWSMGHTLSKSALRNPITGTTDRCCRVGWRNQIDLINTAAYILSLGHEGPEDLPEILR